MKRLYCKISIIIIVVFALTSQAFAIFFEKPTAGYDVYWSDDAAVYTALNGYYNKCSSSIAVASPNASSYQYFVVISYDDLAEKVAFANDHGFIVSLYKNTNAGYWVGNFYDVDFNLWDGGLITPGVLANANGYVYVAEIDTTGDDAVGLLESINNQLKYIEQSVQNIPIYIADLKSLTSIIKNNVSTITTYVSSLNTTVTAMKDSLSSINTSVIGISGRLLEIHERIFDIRDVLTGTAFSTMMSDISTIKTNTTSIVNWQTSAKTHITTIRDNTASMVTLLQGLQSPTITGDVTFDTTALEGKLDTVNTNLQSIEFELYRLSNLLTYVEAWTQEIDQRFYEIDFEGLVSDVDSLNTKASTMIELLEEMQSPTITGDVMFDTRTLELKLDDIDDTLQGGLYNGSTTFLNSILSFLNQRILPVLSTISNKASTISTDVSTMLTYQQEIRDDMQDFRYLAEHQIGLLSYSDDRESYSAAELLYEIYRRIEFLPYKMDDLYGIVRWQWETQQNINTTLNQISDAISDLGDTSAENITNITINEENKVYDVFYITGEDGTEESIADLNGDILSAAGKLLNFFFKVAFDGAIKSVDSTIDGMTDFYLNDAAVLEGSLWE